MHDTIGSTICMIKVFVSCEFWVTEISLALLFVENLGCYNLDIVWASKNNISLTLWDGGSSI